MPSKFAKKDSIPARDSAIKVADDRKINTWNDEQFSKLRDRCGVSSDFLLRQFTWRDFKPGGGKGGQLMAFTQDRRFIIKELSEGDHNVLVDLAEQYVDHMLGGKTLLCIFLMHFLDDETQKKFAVMCKSDYGTDICCLSNCLAKDSRYGKYQYIYDLKGCNDDKLIEDHGRAVKAVHKRVWNVSMWGGDCNWSPERKEYYARKLSARNWTCEVPNYVKESIHEAITRDVQQFLIPNNLMDYSLIVGETELEQMPEIDASSPTAAPMANILLGNKRSEESRETTQIAPPNVSVQEGMANISIHMKHNIESQHNMMMPSAIIQDAIEFEEANNTDSDRQTQNSLSKNSGIIGINDIDLSITLKNEENPLKNDSKESAHQDSDQIQKNESKTKANMTADTPPSIDYVDATSDHAAGVATAVQALSQAPAANTIGSAAEAANQQHVQLEEVEQQQNTTTKIKDTATAMVAANNEVNISNNLLQMESVVTNQNEQNLMNQDEWRESDVELENRGTSVLPTQIENWHHPFVYKAHNGKIKVLAIGLIDFLQTWVLIKKVAMAIKVCERNKATIPPKAYGDRFERRFCQKIHSPSMSD